MGEKGESNETRARVRVAKKEASEAARAAVLADIPSELPQGAAQKSAAMLYAAAERAFVEGNWSSVAQCVKVLHEMCGRTPELAFLEMFGGDVDAALGWLQANSERLRATLEAKKRPAVLTVAKEEAK